MPYPKPRVLSQTTVAQFIEELKKFPPDAIIGAFSSSDGNGPYDWATPVVAIEDGLVTITDA